VRGADSIKFLQGLTTNDFNKLGIFHPAWSCVFAHAYDTPKLLQCISMELGFATTKAHRNTKISIAKQLIVGVSYASHVL
jgi:folate-binding Fe-S cluster repair protein YgfZ